MSKANGKIEVGDTVIVRFPALARAAFPTKGTVLSVKSYDNNATPFWTILTDDGRLLIADFEVVLEVTN